MNPWKVIVLVALIIFAAAVLLFLATSIKAAESSCAAYADQPQATKDWLDRFAPKTKQAILCNVPEGQLGPGTTDPPKDEDFEGVYEGEGVIPGTENKRPPRHCHRRHGKVYDRARSWPAHLTLAWAQINMTMCHKRGRVYTHHTRYDYGSPGAFWSLRKIRHKHSGWRPWHGRRHGAFRAFYWPVFKQCGSLFGSSGCIDEANLPISITAYGDGHFHRRTNF